MAKAVRVSCVNKTDRPNPDLRILNIGGTNPGGLAWLLREADAIAGIERGKWSFHVEQPRGQVLEVVVATRLGGKYLKTAVDGEQPDHLLALPECP